MPRDIRTVSGFATRQRCSQSVDGHIQEALWLRYTYLCTHDPFHTMHNNIMFKRAFSMQVATVGRESTVSSSQPLCMGRNGLGDLQCMSCPMPRHCQSSDLIVSLNQPCSTAVRDVIIVQGTMTTDDTADMATILHWCHCDWNITFRSPGSFDKSITVHVIGIVFL